MRTYATQNTPICSHAFVKKRLIVNIYFYLTKDTVNSISNLAQRNTAKAIYQKSKL